MPQFFVSVYRPVGYDPQVSNDAEMRLNIDSLNDEMTAAGITIYVGGLRPSSLARSIRREKAGVTVSSGSYLNTDEYMDGFWVLKCANLDEALDWGRKAALACQANVEVRPFY